MQRYFGTQKYYGYEKYDKTCLVFLEESSHQEEDDKNYNLVKCQQSHEKILDLSYSWDQIQIG